MSQFFSIVCAGLESVPMIFVISLRIKEQLSGSYEAVVFCVCTAQLESHWEKIPQILSCFLLVFWNLVVEHSSYMIDIGITPSCICSICCHECDCLRLSLVQYISQHRNLQENYTDVYALRGRWWNVIFGRDWGKLCFLIPHRPNIPQVPNLPFKVISLATNHFC